MSATTGHGDTISLSRWARPGIEPKNSSFLVGFVNHWATMGTPLLSPFLKGLPPPWAEIGAWGSTFIPGLLTPLPHRLTDPLWAAFIFAFFFFFLAVPEHVEIPGPAVKSAPQKQPQPQQWQCQILKPLSHQETPLWGLLKSPLDMYQVLLG